MIASKSMQVLVEKVECGDGQCLPRVSRLHASSAPAVGRLEERHQVKHERDDWRAPLRKAKMPEAVPHVEVEEQCLVNSFALFYFHASEQSGFML